MGLGLIIAASTICGFTVKSVVPAPEISAKVWQLEYARNGAELYWIDCADENRTFSIAFRTLPDDDTGVAHIIEHSVLCGSEKYPSREPFVDMLKSSLSTYLNAYTGRDITAYPVASRNERDFLNLMEVYLDAVFNPLSIRDDDAFRQEGWHYEYDGTNLTRSGVVYSEMKGAIANPSTRAGNEVLRALFPDTPPYCTISGGDPAHIPELTFEAYRRFYARHYHPSNSCIFLYGKLDLDKVLRPIARALEPYTRRAETLVIPDQPPVSREVTVRYPSTEEKNRTIVRDGWICGYSADRERMVALEILCELLAGSNFSPLKEPILSAGFCEDAWLTTLPMKQLGVIMGFSNVRDGQADACRKLARETLERLCREGLDTTRISQLIDKREFLWRERDSADLGIDYAHAMLVAWCRGADPVKCLAYGEIFASLRRRNGTGWYERLLRETMLENPHRCRVTLLPSATLIAEEEQAEKADLTRIKATLSEKELNDISEKAAALRRHQEAPEDPAVLARLPYVSLKDIPLTCDVPRQSVDTLDGVTVIRPDLALEGLFYLDLCFSLEGLTDAERLDVPLLCDLFGELASKRRSAAVLRGEMDGTLGVFSAKPNAYEQSSQLVVSFGALDANREKSIALVREVLLETDFSDADAIRRCRAQNRLQLENAANGRKATEFALRRAMSSLSPEGAADEVFRGMSQLRHLQSGTPGDLAALVKRIFTRSGLTVFAAGNLPDDFLRRVIAVWNEAAPVTATPVRTTPPLASDGFEIEGRVSYSARIARLPASAPYSGAQLVAAKILALEYLWPEVRMKGGAYGVQCLVKPNGTLGFTSFRDPDPVRSGNAFAGAADFLESFLARGESFEKYQVSTSKMTDPNLSRRERMSSACALHFNGRDSEYLLRLRREILTTTKADLHSFANVLRALPESAFSRCCFGSAEQLSRCTLDRRESVIRGTTAASSALTDKK